MSRYAHRQPAWGTISVVLLSALLLSPMTGAALLHALALDASWRLSAQPLAPTDGEATPNTQHPAPKTAAAAAPRRHADDDEATALRRAAAALREQRRGRGGPRLYTDPDAAAAATLAASEAAATAFVVLLPRRTVLLVPDDGPRLIAPAVSPGDTPLASRDAARRIPPRAPPVVA